MTTKAPIERPEITELRGEIAGLRDRLAKVEALLLGLYGSQALGGSGPAPKPPAEPARTMRPVASIGRFFVGS